MLWGRLAHRGFKVVKVYRVSKALLARKAHKVCREILVLLVHKGILVRWVLPVLLGQWG